MRSIRPTLILIAVATVAALVAGSDAVGSDAPVRVHAIFGGRGAHVGQVLDVRLARHHDAKVTSICWDPAPIDRPACSHAVNGAPSAAGVTHLTLTLSNATKLHKAIHVTAGYRHRGGHGGSDAALGHVSCPRLTLYGNVPRKGHRTPARDRVTTLSANAQVAQYNRIGDYVFYWQYATNEAGFGKIGCVADGPS